MTKKQLAKKSPEFIEYEEQTLNLVKQRFAKYNESLDNVGLALDIDLLWCYLGEDLTFSRIEFAGGYTCAVCIQIRRKEDPKYDMDLEAITHIQPISQVGFRMFRYGNCYSKVSDKMFKEYLDTVDETIIKVLDKGYTTVLQKIKEKEKF
ncbi:MAG: hypothetical protein K2L12_06620 [Clostridia bacterium]|nr:hypothetical protein [Clostridia bacterium]